jgi:predicted unusual protein kinase regulating ubiquinone biosynthesis (AarF/ABC1/UbiB family)
MQNSIDWRRYRKLCWFLTKTFLHLLWWDVILNQSILRWFRSPPQPRWQRIAVAYRVLAIETGGMLVKLGQFLSLRIDLLPAEVTQELAILQDQMPSVSLTQIVSAIEADLERPLTELFAWFAPEPLASASIAQVHAAHLHSGEHVVVKVLRPGTLVQFEMDLAVIDLLMRGLKQIPPLRAQLDLDVLLKEFTTVTRRELNLVAEGKHAERFARELADDPQVYIPKVYWAYSGVHTLTLENVSYLKISDGQAIEAAGISRSDVAYQLAKLYLKQIFISHFVHADPHPGNVFVKPLPHPDEKRLAGFAPDELVPYRPDRSFQIVLIDFGMSVEIPEQSQTWLREFLIGLGMRDAHRIVQSYATGGILRPGTDRARVEEMTATLIENFQEMLVGLMPDTEKAQQHQLFSEYDDLVQHYPFQIPIDLLFMFRALGLVGSVVKQLDPNFNLSTAAAPLAGQLLKEEWEANWQNWFQSVTTLGQLLMTPPVQFDQVLTQAQTVFKVPDSLNQYLTPPWRALNVQTELNAKDRETLHQLDCAINRLTWMVGAASLFIAGVIWHIGVQIAGALETGDGYPNKFGIALMVLAFVVFWFGVVRKKII